MKEELKTYTVFAKIVNTYTMQINAFTEDEAIKKARFLENWDKKTTEKDFNINYIDEKD